MIAAPGLAALRLMMVTEGRGDPGRVERAVREAVAGGVRAVQVREASLGARELATLCALLERPVRDVGGLLLVNDRIDVAASSGCDGVHLGQRSLPPDLARRLPGSGVVGVSAHDPDEIAAARAGGADYVTLSPVLPTACKPGATALGVACAAAWTAAAGLPVLWLGGLDADTVSDLPGVVPGLRGVAVRGALADPSDARAQARAILDRVVRLLEAAWTPSV